MKTINDLITDAASKLKASGIETPRLDAELLFAGVLGVPRDKLLSCKNDEAAGIAAKEITLFNELVERRISGECTAVITGIKSFRYLEFHVDRNVLIPRPETETLVETALFVIKEKQKNKKLISVLDLCTGSGAVGLSIKYENPETLVTLSDISSKALFIAKKNAERFGLDVAITQSDLFNCFMEQKFDIIIGNPPYIESAEIPLLKKEVQNEPIIALDGGIDGLSIIKKIAANACHYLNAGGFLLLEADPRQMDKIKELLEQNNFNNISTTKDLSGNCRVISAEAF